MRIVEVATTTVGWHKVSALITKQATGWSSAHLPILTTIGSIARFAGLQLEIVQILAIAQRHRRCLVLNLSIDKEKQMLDCCSLRIKSIEIETSKPNYF